MKRVPISERPGIVEKRTRIGDIEVDLMMGSNHKSALLVMTDRTTLITMIEKLESKNANEVYTKMKHRLTRFNPAWIKTITFDNGKEVAYHYKIAKDLNVKTYFTRPIPPRTKELLKIELVLSDAFSLRKRILERYQNKE